MPPPANSMTIIIVRRLNCSQRRLGFEAVVGAVLIE